MVVLILLALLPATARAAKGPPFGPTGIRGSYQYHDILPEFNGGKVTISVLNFLRYTFHRNRLESQGQPVPPNGHVSLWIEQAKIPEEALRRATN